MPDAVHQPRAPVPLALERGFDRATKYLDRLSAGDHLAVDETGRGAAHAAAFPVAAIGFDAISSHPTPQAPGELRLIETNFAGRGVQVACSAQRTACGPREQLVVIGPELLLIPAALARRLP